MNRRRVTGTIMLGLAALLVLWAWRRSGESAPDAPAQEKKLELVAGNGGAGGYGQDTQPNDPDLGGDRTGIGDVISQAISLPFQLTEELLFGTYVPSSPQAAEDMGFERYETAEGDVVYGIGVGAEAPESERTA